MPTLKKATLDCPGFVQLPDAKVEPLRIARQGFPEAIYCPGKTLPQILSIFKTLAQGPGPVLATRVTKEVARSLTRKFSGARYHAAARLVVYQPLPIQTQTAIAVLSAGTADQAVAEEAATTLLALGVPARRIYDVGVAGLHRLMASEKELQGVAACIVCAGMEGALASVIGGLVRCPVIAVPTSVGYGSHWGGLAPLLTMLNSCAANVSVVNIDNGFGAAVIASLIAKGNR